MAKTGEANAAYMREYRARVGGLSAVIKSDDPTVPDLYTHKTVEASVLAEIHLIPNAGRHPGKVAALLALGRLLDDTSASQKRVHPAAVNQLRAGLEELWKAAEKKPASRLEVLRDRARTGS